MNDIVKYAAIGLIGVVLIVMAFHFLEQVSAEKTALLEQKREIDKNDPGHIIANIFGGIFGGLQ